MPFESNPIRLESPMRILKNTLFPALAVLALMSLTLTAAAQEANQLTAKEKAAGWKLLFDGKTTSGWRSFMRCFPTEAGRSRMEPLSTSAARGARASTAATSLRPLNINSNSPSTGRLPWRQWRNQIPRL
jgi:hypothetical protein